MLNKIKIEKDNDTYLIIELPVNSYDIKCNFLGFEYGNLTELKFSDDNFYCFNENAPLFEGCYEYFGYLDNVLLIEFISEMNFDITRSVVLKEKK